MDQEDKFSELKDRIATLEIHEQVFLSMLVALIRTHPHPELFQQLFDAHVEALRARFLGEPIPDKLLDEIELLHDLLTKAFKLSHPSIKI